MASRAERVAAAAKRWAFLREWLEELQRHLYYHEREELDGGTLHGGLRSFCVYVPWPPATTDAYAHTVVRLREALELVALALQLDKNAWLLIAQPGNEAIEDFDPDDYDDGDLTPRFIFKAYKRDQKPGDTTKSIAVVKKLLREGDVQQQHRGAYIHARDKILSMDTRGALTGFRIPVSVLFTPKPMTYNAIRAYMEIAHAIENANSDHNQASPFKLTAIILRAWEWKLNERRAEWIHDLMSWALLRGLAIPEVAIQPDKSELAQAKGPERGRIAKVDALVVADTPLEPFLALFSALTSASTLSRLLLYAAMDHTCAHTRMAKWHALGVALVSGASTSSVRELYIDEANLLVSDAQAFQRGAQSAYPLHDVTAPREEEDPVDRFVRLSDTAKIRLTSKGDELDMARLALSAAATYYVVGEPDDSEWMRVLAPGYGVVYTRCEDVVDVAYKSDIPVTAWSRGRLTQLHIACNVFGRGALAMFIETVSASLVSLDDALFDQFADQFHDRDRKLLVSHATDLPLSAKLAFLSCNRVSSRRRQKSPRTHDQTTAPRRLVPLTQGLVARIFFFARTRLYRVVAASRMTDDAMPLLT